MKVHWHLGYSNKTACGILAYKTAWVGEYDTDRGQRIECAVNGSDDVTCLRCQKVMLLGKWEVPETRAVTS